VVAEANAHGRTVLVTGGASGLGRAVAEAVREAGWRPVVLDRQPAEGFDHELVDLADSGRAEAAVRGVADRSGGCRGRTGTASSR
jgi:NAD(P)-dependent dehydrogenase (short-subunit alcohol dehydrogenase family)